VDLTQEQIRRSPDLDLQKPVTREQELELVRHYRWPDYWSGVSTSGSALSNVGMAATGAPALGVGAMGVYPTEPSNPRLPEHLANDIAPTGVSETAQLHPEVANSEESKVDAELARAAQAEGLHHALHGVREVTGYHIAARDGEIGHVDDFFVDEESWKVEYLLVDTRNWLPGRKVLISTRWITDIVWSDSQVHVNATRQQVKNSPEYEPRETVERSYEGSLYTHYGFPPYWVWPFSDSVVTL
jgi:hypothetical protein